MENKNYETNQLSLFDVIPTDEGENRAKPYDILPVTKVKLISHEYYVGEDLFKGYNELRVITFSYGLTFIEQIMHYFDRGEVIIGFDKLINKKTASLFALQEFSTNQVCNNQYLQKRIKRDEFRFYVLNDLISHQKVYLLKSDDGKVRTITGSINFSGRAWTGDQIETVIVCDDLDFYKLYEKQYEDLRNFSTDEISKDATPIRDDGENLEDLPIFKKIEQNNAILINENSHAEDIDYVFHVEKLNRTWDERIKSIKIQPAKDGKILLELKNVKSMLNAIKKERALIKKRQLINPQLEIDYMTHKVTYNQHVFELNPMSADVQKDIENLLEYMNGFDLFTKDTTRLKTLYWKVLNYLFLSPFIAKLRYEGNRYDYEERFFPMYMLIYGDSDAGKTGFINLVYQLMFGEKLNALTQDNFSNRLMTGLKAEVKGCPILIDELTPTYWKYAKDIVKIDVDLIKNKMTNHPTFIMLSNDISNVSPELSKRIIVINLDNRLDRTIAAENSKKINTIRKKISNSFYREYLGRMFESVEALINDMREHDTERYDDWIPDVFKISSNTIQSIITENGFNIPSELHEFKWVDYMGDKAIGEKATEIIKDEFKHNINIFSTNTQKNELQIDFSCYDTNEAKKKLRILHDELPANVECKIVGSKAIIKLDAIKRHTGLSFKKKGLLWFR